MKKILGLICAFTLLFALVGCMQKRSVQNEPKEYEYIAYEIGVFDASDGGNHSSEFFPWSSDKITSHYDETAPAEAVITFNGVTYTGNYLRSLTRRPNLYKAHRYEGKNESVEIDGKTGQTVFFEINAETGEICSFTLAYEPAPSNKYDESECRRIADSVADDYLSLSDYQVIVSSEEMNGKDLHSYIYYKEYNGIRAVDWLTVSVCSNGHIQAFSTRMLGSFDGVETVDFDSEKAIIHVENKLDSIYEGSETRTGYDIYNQMLIRLPDGNFAILYTIDNRFEKVDGEVTIKSGSQVQLLVTAQPKDDTP